MGFLDKLTKHQASRVVMRTTPLWVSRSGKYAVVQGPFPDGLVRTLTSKELDVAIKKRADELASRHGTNKPHYAKVLASSIVETHNEWGEVCP